MFGVSIIFVTFSFKVFLKFLIKVVSNKNNLSLPSQRCRYKCTKNPRGPLKRKKLIDNMNKETLHIHALTSKSISVYKQTITG